MVIYPCNCNWGIPGVEELPDHNHYQRLELISGQLIDDIRFWVDWKGIAKAFHQMMGPVGNEPSEIVVEQLCTATKRSGWGMRTKCVFKADHPPGQHSWVVDL